MLLRSKRLLVCRIDSEQGLDWPLRGANGTAFCRRLGSDIRQVGEVWMKRMSGWGSDYRPSQVLMIGENRHIADKATFNKHR